MRTNFLKLVLFLFLPLALSYSLNGFSQTQITPTGSISLSSADSNSSSEASRNLALSIDEIVNRYPRIVFDARNPRGGFGDVAANYLTAMDLLEQKGYKGKITIIVGPNSMKIIKTMLGERLIFGKNYRAGRLTFHTTESIPQNYPEQDLYLRFAAKDGADYESKDLRRGNVNSESWDRGKIPLRKNAPIIVQPVLGDTETRIVVNSYGKIIIGYQEYMINNPGIASNEIGAYYDPIAHELQGKPREDVAKKLYDLAQKLKAGSPEQEFFLDLSKGENFKGARMGFAYGISAPQTRGQFVTYLNGLVESNNFKNQSFFITTTSDFRESSIKEWSHKSKVKFIDDLSKVPKLAEKGMIYIVRLPNLPNSLFTTLMAFSELPPVVAGDGAMSAALELGRPFMMTEVSHNRQNVINLNKVLKNYLPPSRYELIDAVYPPEASRTRAALNRYGELMDDDIISAFRQATRDLPDLNDKIFRSIASLQEIKKNPKNWKANINSIENGPLKVEILTELIDSGEGDALKDLKRTLLVFPEGIKILSARKELPMDILLDSNIHQRFLKSGISIGQYDNLISELVAFKDIDALISISKNENLLMEVRSISLEGLAEFSGESGKVKAYFNNIIKSSNSPSKEAMSSDVITQLKQHSPELLGLDKNGKFTSPKTKNAYNSLILNNLDTELATSLAAHFNSAADIDPSIFKAVENQLLLKHTGLVKRATKTLIALNPKDKTEVDKYIFNTWLRYSSDLEKSLPWWELPKVFRNALSHSILNDPNRLQKLIELSEPSLEKTNSKAALEARKSLSYLFYNFPAKSLETQRAIVIAAKNGVFDKVTQGANLHEILTDIDPKYLGELRKLALRGNKDAIKILASQAVRTDEAQKIISELIHKGKINSRNVYSFYDGLKLAPKSESSSIINLGNDINYLTHNFDFSPPSSLIRFFRYYDVSISKEPNPDYRNISSFPKKAAKAVKGCFGKVLELVK